MKLNLFYHGSTIGASLVERITGYPHFHDCHVCIQESGKEAVVNLNCFFFFSTLFTIHTHPQITMLPCDNLSYGVLPLTHILNPTPLMHLHSSPTLPHLDPSVFTCMLGALFFFYSATVSLLWCPAVSGRAWICESAVGIEPLGPFLTSQSCIPLRKDGRREDIHKLQNAHELIHEQF